MKTDNLLLIVAVIAVVVSIIGAGITYNYLTSLRSKVTGLAASGGMVNITIESKIALNFSIDMINWSNGSVDGGETNALLDTTNQTAANVTRGNWIGNHVGLVLENIGNANVSLELKSSNDNETFIGGEAGGGPLYNWKVTNNDTDVSCNFSEEGTVNNTWAEVNDSAGDGTLFCDQFYFEDNQDQLRIDFFVRIPSDSLTGDRGSTITATFSQA